MLFRSGYFGTAAQLMGGSATDLSVRANNSLVFVSNGANTNKYMVMDTSYP